MFCKKCGEKIADNVKFCPKCGEKVERIGAVVRTDLSNATGESDTKKYRYVGIAFVAICVILLCSLMGGKGYEKVLKKYYRAVQYADANLYYSILAPDYIDYMVGSGSWYSSNADFKTALENELEEYGDSFQYDCGGQLRFSVKVTEVKHLTTKERTDFAKNLKDYYEFTHNISDLVELDYKLTVSGTTGSVTQNMEGFYAFKMGGKWYMQKGYVGNF